MGSESNELGVAMLRWQEFASNAESGQLQIPEGVAFQCDRVCAEYVLHLEKMLEKTKWLVDTRAFGTLPSAQMLGAKFKRLADGEERSAAVAIRQHIEVIELMRSVFRRYFVDTEEVDQSVGARVGEIGAALGE
ncbi:hypothetical protein HQO12_14665 [Rhodococcus fascians]|nr:hypothetical protein [Rhodococcus fascians]MBY3810147.1 hypothetical protein [Rhodococcus fascians]MBY3841650.1 hypothetical protein [Rhodococcus fascians]MBY3844681.1 hypothetical protein [Rhodococcus fascians]MBY3850856.1 hypothetical protein [Rhodococcus fascians]